MDDNVLFTPSSHYSHDIICVKWIVCKSDCFYRSLAEFFFPENYLKNIVTLRSYHYSCGMDFPILLKLERLLKLYRCSYRHWCQQPLEEP